VSFTPRSEGVSNAQADRALPSSAGTALSLYGPPVTQVPTS
jgi:hypothetical protein